VGFVLSKGLWAVAFCKEEVRAGTFRARLMDKGKHKVA